jgi:hypothetical protein
MPNSKKAQGPAATSDFIFKSTNIWTRGAMKDYKKDGFEAGRNL